MTMADDIDSLYGAPARDATSRPDTEPDSSLSGLYGEAASTQPRETPPGPDIGDVDPCQVAKQAMDSALLRARSAAEVTAKAAKSIKGPRPSKRVVVAAAGVLALAIVATLAVKFWPHHAPDPVPYGATVPVAATPKPAASTHIYVSPPAPVTPRVAAPVVSAPVASERPPAIQSAPKPISTAAPAAPAPSLHAVAPKHSTRQPSRHVMSAQDRANLDKLNAFFGKQGHQ